MCFELQDIPPVGIREGTDSVPDMLPSLLRHPTHFCFAPTFSRIILTQDGLYPTDHHHQQPINPFYIPNTTSTRNFTNRRLLTRTPYHIYRHKPLNTTTMPASFPRKHSRDGLTTLRKSRKSKCTLLNMTMKVVRCLSKPFKSMRRHCRGQEYDWPTSQEERDFYKPRPEEYMMNSVTPTQEALLRIKAKGQTRDGREPKSDENKSVGTRVMRRGTGRIQESQRKV